VTHVQEYAKYEWRSYKEFFPIQDMIRQSNGSATILKAMGEIFDPHFLISEDSKL